MCLQVNSRIQRIQRQLQLQELCAIAPVLVSRRNLGTACPGGYFLRPSSEITSLSADMSIFASFLTERSAT